MKKTIRKLKLNAETVKTLTPENLRRAVGAATALNTCDPDYTRLGFTCGSACSYNCQTNTCYASCPFGCGPTYDGCQATYVGC